MRVVDRFLAALEELRAAADEVLAAIHIGAIGTPSMDARLARLRQAVGHYLDLTDPDWETRPPLSRERALQMAEGGIAAALDGRDPEATERLARLVFSLEAHSEIDALADGREP
jgi:hypothetical protein